MYCPPKVLKYIRYFLLDYGIGRITTSKVTKLFLKKGIRGATDEFMDSIKEQILQNDAKKLLTALGMYQSGIIQADAGEKIELITNSLLVSNVIRNRELLIEYLRANNVNPLIESIVKLLKTVE